VAEQPLHTNRPLRILIVGAGAAGLLVAHHAPRQLRNVTFACYEKNDDVGGTWFENRYPGLEIDSPSHSYQWSFRPNPAWSRYMAPGPEIWRYLKDWAVESGVMKDVRLGHRVESVVWNDADGVWELKGRRTRDGGPFTDRGDILFACGGGLNNPKLPDVPGIDRFKRTMVHSARWPDDLDLSGKTVAVIGGSGASGVQIVPAIQPVVKKLVVYLRSRFWAVPGVRSRYVGPDRKNFAYSDDLIRRFREDPELLEQYNRDIEDDASWLFRGVSAANFLQRRLLERWQAAR
jgi:cation diffusion facilitator CzcD-associated flavoprotein CzcO